MSGYQTDAQLELVHLRQKVRPTKFLFLVTFQDHESIERIVRLNTALWGGMFNPIVAVEKGESYIRGIFRSSNADFIVNTTDDPNWNNLHKDSNSKVIPLEGWNGLLVREDSEKLSFRTGCDILPFLRNYYREEGRHVDPSKSQSNMALIVGESPEWHKYSLFCDGLYPNQFKHDYEAVYCDATLAKRIVLNESTITALRFYGLRTPLSFTLLKVAYFFQGRVGFDSHIILIGDYNSYVDWLEFWNLRCFGSHILFAPHNILEVFDTNIAEYLEEGDYPLNPEPNDNVRNHTLIQKSHSISKEEFDLAVKYIVAHHKEHPKVVQDWLPKFGRTRSQRIDVVHGPPTPEAPIGNSAEQEDIVFVANNQVEFKPLVPEYLLSGSGRERRSWSIALSFWGTRDSDLCFKYPALPAVEKALRKNYQIHPRSFSLSKKENVVWHREEHSLGAASFRPLKTLDLFKAIFQESGLTVTGLSEKGQYATRIEEMMGGQYGGAGLLRDKGVRELLTRLANENSESSLPQQELERIVGSHSPLVRDPSDPVSPAQIVNALIDRKVLRPGLELKCEHCYKRGWYHISQFDEEFTCRYCFTKQPTRVFNFSEWRYRSSGLFSTKDVGFGSMVVIAAALFFQFEAAAQDLYRIYSFNLQESNHTQYEVDLAVFQIEFDGEYKLALCECKTSDFNKTDFEKLRKLIEIIPESVACIATMKSQFSDSEKEQAKKFWDQGFPLILLTDKELESGELDTDRLPANLRYGRDFLHLAQATSHLYLQPLQPS